MNDVVEGLEDLSAVTRIELGGLTVTSREQLMSIVENPILEACQIIFDKNIETIMSSANPEGGYYIDFASDSLSDENKLILEQSGGIEGTMHGSESRRKYIKIQLNNPKVFTQVTKWGLDLAKSLKKQDLKWGGYSLEDLELSLGGMSDEDYDGKNKIQYWIDSGYFYNFSTGLFYSSQEMYDKSLKK